MGLHHSLRQRLEQSLLHPHGIGPTHGATILPISNSLDLSTVWESYPDFMNPQTAFFNYTNLNAPVPQSIYNSQPQCATAPYAPILVVPSSLLQRIDPAWRTCSADIRGLYDPPYALHAAEAAAAPTPSSLNFGSGTAAPDPAPAPTTILPSKTGNPTRPSSPGNPSSPGDPPDPSSPGSSSFPDGRPPPGNSPAPGNPASPGNPSPPGKPSSPGDPSSLGHPPSPTNPSSPDDSPSPGIPNHPSGNTNPDGSPLGEGSPQIGSSSGTGSSGSPSGGDPDSSGSLSGSPPPNGDSLPGDVPSGQVSSSSQGSQHAGAGYSATENPGSGLAPVLGGQLGYSSNLGSVAGESIAQLLRGADSNGDTTDISGNDAAGKVASIVDGPDSDGDATNTLGGDIAGKVVSAEVSESSAADSGGKINDENGGSVDAPDAQGTQAIGQSDGSNEQGGQQNAGFTSINGLEIAKDPSDPNKVVIGSQHVSQGEEVDIDGTTVSVGATNIVIGISSSISMPAPASDEPAVTAFATVGGEDIYVDPHYPSAVILGGTRTLEPGQTAVVDGTSISVGLRGLVLSASTTVPIPTNRPGSGSSPVVKVGITSAVEVEAIFSIDGRTYTAFELAEDSGTAVVLGPNHQLITLEIGGPPATLDGQKIYLASDGVQIGTANSEASWVTTIETSLPSQLSSMESASRLGSWVTTSASITGVQASDKSGAGRNCIIKVKFSGVASLWMTFLMASYLFL
ncbi:MAG: hypothetical protein M1821_008742 [Bathelium mastoideum]|nr:MAG: hypothetical protein M1821_008742 [Bathelium mastoideum]